MRTHGKSSEVTGRKRKRERFDSVSVDGCLACLYLSAQFFSILWGFGSWPVNYKVSIGGDLAFVTSTVCEVARLRLRPRPALALVLKNPLMVSQDRLSGMSCNAAHDATKWLKGYAVDADQHQFLSVAVDGESLTHQRPQSSPDV
jgi:hypothetical protein